uniref:Uncharacterized protein n=1 Tax=Megaviridae environmental sample TaxID=1737588 RepID=A0A5J6VJ99_9VIRU|nr:MAG: hypothetical protein [Megaviridae environmental sample]
MNNYKSFDKYIKNSVKNCWNIIREFIKAFNV